MKIYFFCGARSLRSLARYTSIYFCRYISGSCPPPPPNTKKLATLLKRTHNTKESCRSIRLQTLFTFLFSCFDTLSRNAHYAPTPERKDVSDPDSSKHPHPPKLSPSPVTSMQTSTQITWLLALSSKSLFFRLIW